MTEKKEDATDARRTQVKDLPREERELTADEQKKVQGGATRAVQPGIRTYPTGGGTSSSG
jgi:hypothetical protein